MSLVEAAMMDLVRRVLRLQAYRLLDDARRLGQRPNPVEPPELSESPDRTFMLPPPAYYDTIREGAARRRSQQLHVGPLWRCWHCMHWCSRSRSCCNCGRGSAP